MPERAIFDDDPKDENVFGGTKMKPLAIGFIGFGEAAFHLAKGLNSEGLRNISAYDKFWDVEPQSALIRQRADEAGVSLTQGLPELCERAQVVFSAVSANLALSLAESACPHLRESHVYVDLNATSPMTKEEIDHVLPKAVPFVDCAVMGPVPTYGHKVPVTISGRGAGVFKDMMAPYGMNITLMDAPAGSASASKMFRSIFMKGFVVLVLEMLDAGHRYGVEDDVMGSVNKTLTSGPLPDVINGLVGRGVIHSERREHEMEDVIATLDRLGVDSTMSQATQRKLRWCTGLGLKDHFRGLPPEDFHEIFDAIDEIRPSE